VSPHRQVELHGAIDACDAAGRTLHVHCTGEQLKIDADSARAGLSALSALRAMRASGGLDTLALGRLDAFQIELCVRGRLVGRAGRGARANWLGRALAQAPLELHAPALLRAALLAF
jgi:hypothetical protein